MRGLLISSLALIAEAGAGTTRVKTRLINVCMNSFKSSTYEMPATEPGAKTDADTGISARVGVRVCRVRILEPGGTGPGGV